MHTHTLIHSLTSAHTSSAFHAFEPFRMHYPENKDSVLWMMLISQLLNREYDNKTLDLMNIMLHYVTTDHDIYGMIIYTLHLCWL